MALRPAQAELAERRAVAPRTASATRSYAATSSARRTSASPASSTSSAANTARRPASAVRSAASGTAQPAALAAAAAATVGNRFRQILAPVRRHVGRARSSVATTDAAIQPIPIAGAPTDENSGTLTANHTTAYAVMARSTAPAASTAYR